MERIGITEAKRCSSQLLTRVSHGDRFQITRRGVAVANLVPLDEIEKKDLKKIVQEIREISKGASLDTKIRDLINEGRRY